MAYLQDIVNTQNEQLRISAVNNEHNVGLPPGAAYSSYFPTWEVTAPQYVQPNAYTETGFYKTNELAYACINLRMKTVSEPPTRVWDKKKKAFIEGHPYEDFIKNPCPGISQSDFIASYEMYLQIAGGMGWEKNRANDGSLLNVYPMLPQYCSFMRGEGLLLRAIRYQPYTGLPYLDIPRERVVWISYVDPLYYGLKPFSPTMVINDVLGVDNNMTTMIGQFIKNAGFLSGMMKTEQIIDDADANFVQQRFAQAKGGPNNAGQILVVGKGMDFVRMNNTFREMVIPELDSRNETRICLTYSVPPILVSAKSGMDRSTYSNYEQARKAWYEETVTNEWRFIAQGLTRDLLTDFDDDPDHEVRFDTQEVQALQEDRTASWNRAMTAFKDGVIVRNDALREMGLELLPDTDENGKAYYVRETAMSQTSNNLDIVDSGGQAATAVKPQTETPPANEQDTNAKTEEKKFHEYASKRVEEQKPWKIPLFEFKHISPERQRVLLSKYGVLDESAEAVFKALMAIVDKQNVNA